MLYKIFAANKLMGWLTSSPPVLGALVLLLLLHPGVRRRLEAHYPLLIVLGFIVTRIGMYLLVYVIMGYKGESGDIQSPAGGWFISGTSVLAGQIPYRDFFSNYSVLFSYLMSLPYMISKDPTSVVLLFIAFDVACLFLLRRVVADFLGKAAAFNAVLIYTFTPLSWFICVRYAQDEIVFAFFALLAIHLWQRKSYDLSALVLGLGFCFTKFMFGLVMLPFLFIGPFILRRAAIMALVVVGVNLPFALAGANVFSPITNQVGSLNGRGIWQTFNCFFPNTLTPMLLNDVASVLILAALGVSAWAIIRRKINPSDGSLVFLLWAIALSPKTYPFYMLSYLPMLIVFLMRTNRWTGFIIFSMVASMSMQVDPAVDGVQVLDLMVRGKITWQALMVLACSTYMSLVQVWWAVSVLRARRESPELPEPVGKPVEQVSAA